MGFDWKIMPNKRYRQVVLSRGDGVIRGVIWWDTETDRYSVDVGRVGGRKLFDTPEEAEQWARLSAIRQLKKALKELEGE